MKTNCIHIGDALTVLKSLPAESVHMCVTSPPYYGLRDYGAAGQIGLETTPSEYIARLTEVFLEVGRVLRADGTLWVNIGDSYAGSGKGGAFYPDNAKRYKQGTNRGLIGAAGVKSVTWGDCKNKELLGIPWQLAFSLRSAGYYLRQDIIWAKPNPMPESVKDRCTKSHEYIFLFSKNVRYYYDAESIAEPVANSKIRQMKSIKASDGGKVTAPRYSGGKYANENTDPHYRPKSKKIYEQRAKRNKRDVWTISTKPYKGAHFATYPVDLVKPCILAGCPPGGIVLDPFFGSGTTGVAAVETGREFIGIELNADFVALAENRIKGIAKQVSMF